MTPEQLEIARANAQRIVNAGGTDAIDYPVAVGFLSLIAQVEALTVPQWIRVEDRLPEDRQDVTFVVRASGPFQYLNGRVLAGTFIASYCGDFSVPGLTVGASYWMASPAAPTIPAIPGTKEGA